MNGSKPPPEGKERGRMKKSFFEKQGQNFSQIIH